MTRSNDPRQLEMVLTARHVPVVAKSDEGVDYVPLEAPQLEMRLVQAPPAHAPWRWPKGYNARPNRRPGQCYPCGETVPPYDHSRR
jgi:hypothetical protein